MAGWGWSMTEYKDTLSLPRTGFPMRAQLPRREPGILGFWQERDIEGRLRRERHRRPRFVLHDGPPYANGPIHIGHAVNKILKDIVVKHRSLDGYDAPYRPGWDCHGLPVELQVEKKGGGSDAREFRRRCRAYVETQVAGQREAFVRLGVLGRWAEPYLTMEPGNEADIVRAIGQLVRRGVIEHGVKPVHWCLKCGSALSEAEIEYLDHTSPAIDVRFLADGVDRVGDVELDGRRALCCAVWTTTPWTLPANLALCVHPDMAYVVYDCGEEYVLVARKLAEAALERYRLAGAREIGEVAGRALVGMAFRGPWNDRVVPVLAGSHVTEEAGTGIVHTAPDHGVDDFNVGSAAGLTPLHLVDGRGRFVDGVDAVGGERVFDANAPIIERLRARGRLLCAGELRHSYPHCWRHHTPIIFRATPQWFILMDSGGLRERALELVKDVEWFPQWGDVRISRMISDRPDWCISRQRRWGVPLPFFFHKETHQLHPRTTEIVDAVAELVERDGIDAWFDAESSAFLDATELGQYERVHDVADVWLDSGLTHATVLRSDGTLAVPADLYLEGSDQYRGWFQSSLLTSAALYGSTPYRQVLTHGFVVDESGRKMSKSLGNVIDPADVIKRHGADVLRLWVASTDYSAEMSLSDQIIERTVDIYRRLRNTLRFLLGNTHDFHPARDAVPLAECVELDRWALRECFRVQEQVQSLYLQYRFHIALREIIQLCTVTLGAFYLDICKDRLYTAANKGPARRSAQTAMHLILEATTRWLAPVLSFTAEEVWQEIRRAGGVGAGANGDANPSHGVSASAKPDSRAGNGMAEEGAFGNIPDERPESILLAEWLPCPAPVREWLNEDAATTSLDARWQRIAQLRRWQEQLLEPMRQSKEIASALDVHVSIYCAENDHRWLSPMADELRFALLCSHTTVHKLDEAPPTATQGDEHIRLSVTKTEDPKCQRCWQRRPTVGQDSQHPTLCDRCITNIQQDSGEHRRYA